MNDFHFTVIFIHTDTCHQMWYDWNKIDTCLHDDAIIGIK